MPRGKEDVSWFVASYDKLLKFRYVNWHGDEHEYVVEPEAITFGPYDKGGGTPRPRDEYKWVLHAYVVTRDDDVRSDMDLSNRRRTFLLRELRCIEEVERSK